MAIAHVYNLTDRQPTFYRSLLSVTRGRFEGSVKCGRDGPHFPKLDFMDLGLSYLHYNANVSATLSLKPEQLSRDSSELHVGISKNFGTNMLVKAKYALLSGIGTYYTDFLATKDCTVAGTLQVAHRSNEGVFKGFWGYPLNFGLSLNVKA